MEMKYFKWLKTAVGQLSAVERMLSDGVCCTEVATQIAAVQGLMKKIVSLWSETVWLNAYPRRAAKNYQKLCRS